MVAADPIPLGAGIGPLPTDCWGLRLANGNSHLGRVSSEQADGHGAVPVIPPDDVSVVVNRCQRPAGQLSVQYPGMDGGYMLLLQQGGAFHLRSSRHQVVVNPTVSVFARAGEPADISHPYGQGDRSTFVVLSPEVFDAVAGVSATVPGVAPATGHVARLHRHLLRLSATEDGLLAVEDAAIRVFVAALAGAEPRRPEAATAGGRRQQQIVDDACGALADDPTIDSLVHLGRVVGCSPHHLSRVFHQRMGKTLVRHRLELRVHRALEHLQDEEITLAEVAVEAGFADHAHLTRSFRRVLGATPSELRGSEMPPAKAQGCSSQARGSASHWETTRS